MRVNICGLMPKQKEILKWFMAKQSNITMIQGCRGAGKSALSRVIIGVQSQLYPGKDIIYASQSCDNSESQFNECIKNPYISSLLRAPSQYGAPYSKQPCTLHFANGGNCVFWSMEKGNAKRGRHLPTVIVDEAQNIRDSDFNDILSPMADLPDNSGSILVLGSCPIYGTWYYDLGMKGKKFPNDADVRTFSILPEDSACFQGPQGQRRLLQKKAAIGEVAFSSEYELKVQMPGDSYFMSTHIDQCLDGKAQSASDEPTILYYDPATGGAGGDGDPAAILVMNADGYVLHSYSWPQTTDARTKLRELGETAKKYKSFVLWDSCGAASTKDTTTMTLNDYCPYGVAELPFLNHVKKGYFDDFAWALENNLVHIDPVFENLIQQVRIICSHKSSSGYITIKGPYKTHDDEVLALVGAYQGIKQGYLEKFRVKDERQRYQSLNLY